MEEFFSLLDEILEKYNVSPEEIETLYAALDDTDYSVEAETDFVEEDVDGIETEDEE